MTVSQKEYLTDVRAAVHRHFVDELVPFWLDRSIDRQCGGYLTAIDRAGELDSGRTDKYIVIQTRMVWSFARFSRFLAHDPSLSAALKAAAQQGVDFLLAHMWDADDGGWFWQCTREGQVRQADKVTYGQSFAVYALAEYTRATGDRRGLDYADRTFGLLERHGLDEGRGGYIESFKRDWAPANGAHFSGSRKSLNTQMHLMEAFTTLAEVSGQARHAQRLKMLVNLITGRMVDRDSGAGHDWFDLEIRPERSDRLMVVLRGEDGVLRRQMRQLDPPVFLNSYGHDVELAWLLADAAVALGQPRDAYLDVMRGLVDHALEHGLDRTHGGLYFDGQHNGPALSRAKGWWQQAEGLVGLLDLYALTGEEEYLDAFRLVWDFSTRYVINHPVGEWCQLVAEDGQLLEAALGDEWKGAYHTGRAMIEVLQRLDRILNGAA